MVPRLLPLHLMLRQANAAEPVQLTPSLALSSEKLQDDGVYLAENGCEGYIYFAQRVPTELVRALIGARSALHKFPSFPPLLFLAFLWLAVRMNFCNMSNTMHMLHNCCCINRLGYLHCPAASGQPSATDFEVVLWSRSGCCRHVCQGMHHSRANCDAVGDERDENCRCRYYRELLPGFEHVTELAPT